MAKLTLRETVDLEELFEMEDGRPLNFSDRTFRHFIARSIDVDADDPKYSEENSGSKANRLRTIWELESDVTVGRLVDALIEHRGARPEIYRSSDTDDTTDYEGPDPKADLIERCRAIARRLAGGTEDRPAGHSQETSMTTPTARTKPNSVFVVHGRHHIVRNDLFKFLRVIGLQPMLFDDARSSGSEMNFDVVRSAMESAAAVLLLLTPEEASFLRDDLRFPGEEGHVWHPRPNVIFEAGWALGAHQTKTTIVEAGFTHSISDMHGFNTVRMTGVSSLNDLVNRLRILGLEPKTTDSAWMDVKEYPGLLSGAPPTMPTTRSAMTEEPAVAPDDEEYDAESLIEMLKHALPAAGGFVKHSKLDELAEVPKGSSKEFGATAATQAGRLEKGTAAGLVLKYASRFLSV